jgi:hypothetical protein
MRHHNLDVASATKAAKSLRPIIDPIGMCVRSSHVDVPVTSMYMSLPPAAPHPLHAQAAQVPRPVQTNVCRNARTVRRVSHAPRRYGKEWAEAARGSGR